MFPAHLHSGFYLGLLTVTLILSRGLFNSVKDFKESTFPLFRKAINSTIQDMIEATQSMLSTINLEMRKPTREAAAFLSEFMQLMKPRCEGDLRNLHLEYIDKHEWLKAVLADVKKTMTNYGRLIVVINWH